MNHTEIDLRALVAEVRNAAAKTPDKCFGDGPGEGCRYFDHDGSPVCIVGQALSALGATYGMLGPGDNDTGIRFVVQQGNTGLTFVRGDVDEYRHIEWLAAVQGMQDSGRTWSEAVQRADAKWPLPVGA